jgi:hypothetical protein
MAGFFLVCGERRTCGHCGRDHTEREKNGEVAEVTPMKMKLEFEATAWKIECEETALVIRLENPPKHVKQAAKLLQIEEFGELGTVNVSVTMSEAN